MEATVEARVDVAVAAMTTRAMEVVTNTHNHSKLTSSKPLPRACPHKRALQPVVTTLMTPTLLMVATRITLLCGSLQWPSSKAKDSRHREALRAHENAAVINRDLMA